MHQPAFPRLFWIVLVPWFLSGGVVPAAEHRADGQLLIAADEVVEDDLYCFGDEVTIDGKVNGDVVAFGRVVRVNGTVEGDLICAAQAIVISGKVSDDVRMAGQVLKIDSEAAIGDDVFAAGFSLQAMEQTSIDGELVYAGYQALLAGSVGEQVRAGLVNCEIGGSVGGDVKLGVGSDQVGAQAYTAGSPPPISIPNVPAGLTIRDTARIAGGLEYASHTEANIEAGAQVAGEIKHELQVTDEIRPTTPIEKASRVFGRYAALLIVGLGILLIAPTWMRQMSENIRERPAACLGFGVVGIVGVVVFPLIILVVMIFLAVVAGFIQLTGLVPVVIVLGLSSVSIVLIGFWFFAVYLAEIVFGFLAGSWLLKMTRPTLGDNRFLALLIGLLLLASISVVPYLGSIVGWLVVLIGVGALAGWLFRRIKPRLDG